MKRTRNRFDYQLGGVSRTTVSLTVKAGPSHVIVTDGLSSVAEIDEEIRALKSDLTAIAKKAKAALQTAAPKKGR